MVVGCVLAARGPKELEPSRASGILGRIGQPQCGGLESTIGESPEVPPPGKRQQFGRRGARGTLFRYDQRQY